MPSIYVKKRPTLNGSHSAVLKRHYCTIKKLAAGTDITLHSSPAARVGDPQTSLGKHPRKHCRTIKKLAADADIGADDAVNRAPGFASDHGSPARAAVVLADVLPLPCDVHRFVSTHFICMRCKKDLLIEDMSQSMKNVCTKDVNSYKALRRQLNLQRHLRPWWASLSSDDQADWYRRNQLFPAGLKRQLDSLLGNAD
jgi:hypothetical protein